MSYAIRNDNQAFRAVNGPDDIGPDEYWSEFPIEIIPLPPTTEELLRAANAERDRLLAIAAIRIAPLQDAVDLDEATSTEVAMLKKWKQYRVLVNRVQDQADFPVEVNWPPEPS